MKKIQILVLTLSLLSFFIGWHVGSTFNEKKQDVQITVIEEDTTKPHIYIWPESSETISLDDVIIRFKSDTLFNRD